MKSVGKLALLLAAGTGLAGCQSLFGSSSQASFNADASSRAGDVAAFAVSLEEGRAYLKQGRIAAAIGAFKVAQLGRDTKAEATNGLAVAYARLGRQDLARRYFAAAARLDPGNPIFAANLARLERNTALAQQQASPDTARLAVAEEQSMRIAGADAETGNSKIERLSRGTVHIRLNNSRHEAPDMTVVARETSQTPSIASGADSGAAKYPVRVRLQSSDGAKTAFAGAGGTRQGAYPVRVSFR